MFRNLFLFIFFISTLSAFIYYKLYKNSLSTICENDLTDGNFIEILNYKIFVRILNENATGPDIIFIHGFPTSSLDYKDAMRRVNAVLPNSRLISHDHIGFGNSEKPINKIDYSIRTYADFCLILWRILNVKSAHIIAHDMGDSVLTEILYRIDHKLITNNFIKSVMFMNGGMIYNKISFRFGQLLLLNPITGNLISRFYDYIPLKIIARKQLSNLIGPDSINMTCHIENMLQNIDHNNQWAILNRQTSYLNERQSMDHQWLNSLKSLSREIPCFLLWGDSDAVSPIAMFEHLVEYLPECRSTTMKNIGHFPMIESPDLWLKLTKQWLQRSH